MTGFMDRMLLAASGAAEEEDENAKWIEEMNAICEQAVSEAEADKWKDEEHERHPLIERTFDFAVRIHKEAREWLPEDCSAEHPLIHLMNGLTTASAKLGVPWEWSTRTTGRRTRSSPATCWSD